MSTPTQAAATVYQVWCCGQKLAVTVGEAGLEIKAILVTLWAGAVVVLVTWLRGVLIRDGQAERRLALLGGWQAGAPLLALAAVAYLAMNFAVALYAYPPATVRDYAPGWAEMALVLWSGLFTGALAAFARAAVQARAILGR